MDKIRNLIVLLIVMSLALALVGTARDIESSDYRSSADASGGVALLEQYENNSVDDVQNSIDELYRSKQESLATETLKKRVETSIRRIDNGELTYREVFRDVYVAGDSLMVALDSYELINRNHVMAKVSATLVDLKNNIPKIESAKPRVLILHYGLNGVYANENYAIDFASRYKELIEKIQTVSPNTRIIVSLIFPIDRNREKKVRFNYIERYNELIVEMCKETGVEYLDSADIVNANMHYCGGDGIHFAKEFYTEHWFKHIMREMGIY